MIAESLAAEAAREIERLLGADATQTLGVSEHRELIETERGSVQTAF